MESLNLNNLASSLPPPNLAKAEKDLTDNFKAAALSLTTLYRCSKRTSKRAYNAGYAAACQDLLVMIQQGVSAGESSDSDGQGMTIGRIMDYVEARLEAIRSREEEEDEDEEKDRDRERSKPGTSTAAPAKPAPPAAATKPPAVSAPTPAPTPSAVSAKSKDHVALAPPTPYTPSTLSANSIAASSPSPLGRTAKSRLYALANAKDPSILSATPAPFGFDTPNTAVFSPPTGAFDLSPSPADAPVGSKRRHNMMLLDAPVQAAVESGPSTRRRTRSARGAALAAVNAQAHQQGLHIQDHNVGADAMDVEEEGRERKRVARR
ncbi:uncharacterized protein B0H18DRAFT_1018302 [Fomitopsis serialis]|uniref:uncharacterized protein n=1 Tax=Fomitopsis serialis TaxID=139415 RepID=UPI002007D56C|nr:uncharacterized protein B0H18DRAFT_1018302 [Neoantrodia serialis]KAH9922424.1 hypothetical protein B0H18DRAFT_1018302 [Neoantrodia serialis]